MIAGTSFNLKHVFVAGMISALLVFGSTFLVLADTDSDTVTIDATVPDGAAAVCGNGAVESGEQCDDGNVANGDGCSSTCQNEGGSPGGGGGDSTPPVISDVEVTSTLSTADVSWVATDNVAVSSCEFTYSTDETYGSSGSVSDLPGDDFSVSLSGLTSSTVYFYRITCSDTAGNEDIYEDTFITSAPISTVNLTLTATPERRVEKEGGNLQMDFILLVVDPTTNSELGRFEAAIGNDGIYSGPATLPSTVNGAVVLKGISHLGKRIVGVTISDGSEVTLDFTDGGVFSLFAGDVAGFGLRDNFVDVLDISATLPELNSDTLQYDLNRDDIVDVLDISIVLANFNREGDQLPTS